MTVADAMTRTFLISAMVLIPIGILITFVPGLQSSGAVVIAFGLAGTLGAGIVRSSMRRELLRDSRSADSAEIRAVRNEQR